MRNEFNPPGDVFLDFPEETEETAEEICEQSSKVTFIYKSGAIFEIEFGFDAFEFLELWNSTKHKVLVGIDIANGRLFSINKKDVSSFFVDNLPKKFIEKSI